MGAGVEVAPQERGWRSFLPALLAFLLVPLLAPLPAVLPIQETLLLLVPAVAACALAAWRLGGRLSLALLWTALAGWYLSRPTTPAASATYDVLARGWALLLAASFGLTCVAQPRGRFLVRALSAVALALAVALSSAMLVRGGLTRTASAVSRELARRNDLALTRAAEASRQVGEKFPLLKPITDDALRDETMAELPRFSAPLFPALLALESIAALALAWALFHRLSRTRIGSPLGALREFRFSDQLVWGVIVGVTILLLPTLAGLRAVGTNLLFFFGVLYALRGLGVLAWFAALGRLWTPPLVGFALLLLPVAGAVALGLGLGDTWLDWRNGRPRPTT